MGDIVQYSARTKIPKIIDPMKTIKSNVHTFKLNIILQSNNQTIKQSNNQTIKQSNNQTI